MMILRLDKGLSLRHRDDAASSLLSETEAGSQARRERAADEVVVEPLRDHRRGVADGRAHLVERGAVGEVAANETVAGRFVPGHGRALHVDELAILLLDRDGLRADERRGRVLPALLDVLLAVAEALAT